MDQFICPKCGNYTYDHLRPCPKCGFNFESSKKIVLKVKNCTKHTIYYDFSYGAGLSIMPDETVIIKMREGVVLTFYFHTTDEHNKITRYRCDFIVDNEKYYELFLIGSDGKYSCREFTPYSASHN